MKSTYFKIAWRNIMKSKVFSFINIFGLAIGIAVCMMIFLFIMNEFSFDRFHRNGENIYRVMRGFDDNGSKKRVPSLSPPYADALKNDYPDAIKQTLRVEISDGLVTFGENAFKEKQILMVDPNFFTLFSFPLVKGDPATALKDPASIVLTESTAKKYFGDDDPMGKIVVMDKELQLKVTGIAKDVPSNSHLEFDLVAPLANYERFPGFNKWVRNRLYTYVELNDNINKSQVEKTFPQFMDKYMGQDMKRIGMQFDLGLTPLYDIYFEPHVSDKVRHGDKSVAYIFLSIAVLILVIACINFMNLSTIRSVERSKEIGVRKVIGALRNHLVWQFIGESIMLATISCIIAVGLFFAFLPTYNSILGEPLSVAGQIVPLLLFLPGVILLVGILAGVYPAVLLSSFSPIQSLKGKLRLGSSGAFFRQSLVVLQFSISVILIIGTIIIVNQMSYVRNKDLGYNEEQTVVVQLDNYELYKGRKVFKNELKSKDDVTSVSFMSGEPGGFFDGMGFDVEGNNGQLWKSRTEFTDADFAKTLGLKIVAGRDFSTDYATDSADAALINETAAAELGLTPQQAVGKWIQNTQRDSTRRRIVGVVQDFNFLSLKEKMSPLVIAQESDYRVVLIRLKPGRITSGLASVKDAFKQIVPTYPFEYSFLDQKFDMLYKKDIRQQTILTVFSGLAIFIACMGLFGLASFTAAKRVKEIGIRKVLGSSVRDIVVLLSKDLLKPVLLATVIAIPFGYYFMDRWLQNFAYRTSLHWWVFAAAAAIALFIAVFTVSFQTMRAALANPTKSLRSE